MPSISRATALATGLLATAASAAFNAASSKNVAVYWGQGAYQIPLSDVCNDENVDIVNLAFVNQFPKARGEYPATNFANACGGEYFAYPNGTLSGLLSSCPSIGPGIKECQAKGKKVLLSVGGGWPTDYYLQTKDIAEYFAEFLWGAFGPQTNKWVADGKPRPFGDASVDGFDLDLEAWMDPAPFNGYQDANYDYFVKHLKNKLFPTGPSTYYISGAPQCIVPDARLASAISKSSFDFVFVQFYNTPQCSSRAGYNGVKGAATDFTFDKWVAWLKQNSVNKKVKLYLGLPASEAGAPSDKTSYLTPAEANTLVSFYAKKYPEIFGGVMLWEATLAARNEICSKNYNSWMKDILLGKYSTAPCQPKPSSSTRTSSTISSTRSSTISSTVSSTKSSTISSTLSSTISSTLSSTASSTTSSAASSTSSTVLSSSTYSASASSSAATSSAQSSVYPTSSAATSSATSSTVLSSSSPTQSSVYDTSSAATSSAAPSSVASSSVQSSVYETSSAAPSSAAPSSVQSSVYETSSTAPSSAASSIVPSETSAVESSVYETSSAASSIVPSETSAVESSVYETSSAASSIVPSETSAIESSVYVTSSETSSIIPSETSAVDSSVYPTVSDTSAIVPSETSLVESSVYATSSASPSAVYTSGQDSTSGNAQPTESSYPSDVYSSLPYPTGSNQTSSGVYPSEYQSTSTPCTTGTLSSTNLYPGGPSSTPAGHSGYPSASPSPTSSAQGSSGYPVASSKGPVVTKTITTSYVDICSTGFTTITTTITKTVCPKCEASPTDVPEGWYTTVTVCGHCGPKPTTVTLTKPLPHETEGYYTPQPTGESYVPAKPAGEAYIPGKPEGEAYVPETPEETVHMTDTVVQVITLTKVPVPYTPSPAPYAPANSTRVYAPIGTASSSGYGSYPTAVPSQFEGAASRFGMGMSMVVVLVAGVFLL